MAFWLCIFGLYLLFGTKHWIIGVFLLIASCSHYG